MKKGSEKPSDKETADNPPPSTTSKKSGKENGNFAIGSRLEARDVRGNWYPAKIENINSDDQVLIHFDGWSNKYNEWVPMNSERLRAVQKPAPKKPPEQFTVGEKVLALWSAYHKSEATVQEKLPDGRYGVVFHDGYVKNLLPSRMWHIDEADATSKSAMPDIGSKQDRRNRKRKHVVSELFRSNKRPRSFSEPVEKKAPLLEEPKPSTAVPPPTAKVKQPLEAPKPFDVTYLDGHKETWSKFTTRRTEGKTAGKIEIVISSPSGRKFRSKSEIVRFCDDKKIQYEPKIFDFSAKGRLKGKTCSESTEKVAASTAQTAPEAPAPVVVPAAVTALPDTELQEEKRFIGELEVVVQDGQFICPVTDCRKHFRKENLLHMHTKHYHPDLSKFLDYTPSVTDLAYARTVSILEQDNSPTIRSSVRQDLRSAEVKRSPSRNVDVKQEVKLETEPTGTESGEPTHTTLPTSASDAPVPAEGSMDSSPAVLTAGGADVQPPEQADEATIAPTALPRLAKPHWRRRPYHRGQVAASDWYGRAGKQPGARTVDEPTGKQGTEPVGTIVQRNPILNTLLSSRPLAPVMSWRSNWRRKRRRGWRRRLHQASHPPPPKTEPVDGLDESKLIPTADGLMNDGSMATDVKYDKLKGNEIINCSCLIKEEDGLMIQCDQCLCWQHGHCQGINPQTDVPESYTCSICKDPPRGRSSRKYYNNQDWMKQGTLPTLPSQPKQSSPKRILLKRAFEVSGQLTLISRLLHSLRVKLSVAANKDHPKLWLWAKKWQEEDAAANSQPVIKTETPETPTAPEPEKPIDPIECKINLLDHILHYQELVQNRLDSLEGVVTELESMDGAGEEEEETEKVTRISATIKMLLRDLETVKKLSALP